jgi:hypothetical protein
VFWQTGKLPKGMWIPDQGVAPYRGRGQGRTSGCASASAGFVWRSSRAQAKPNAVIMIAVKLLASVDMFSRSHDFCFH